MTRHWKYFVYVLRHKRFVLQEGRKLGVSLLSLLLHDWDKFRPDEWLPYARTFYAPDGKSQYKESVEFARAWMLHQHRNRHHWQYWLNFGELPLILTYILVWDRGNAQEIVERNEGALSWLELRDRDRNLLTADPMPDADRREMLADWRGAGRAVGKPDTAAWYLANRDKMILHPNTRAWIEQQLEVSQ